MTELDRAAAAIEGASAVALACHVTPDGDALGSMLALHHLCRAAGKPSVASWPDPFVVASHYTYLPGLDLTTKPADFPAAPEVMVTFDCGSLARLGELAWPAEAAGELIVVDHHATNDCYGSINVIDVDRRFVATWITADDLARYGVEIEETEGLIDIVRRVQEADISCVLKETPDGTRVSLRAVNDFDVAAIALGFGGGGHRAAAGFTSDQPIPDVLEAIRASLPVVA